MEGGRPRRRHGESPTKMKRKAMDGVDDSAATRFAVREITREREIKIGFV